MDVVYPPDVAARWAMFGLFLAACARGAVPDAFDEDAGVVAGSTPDTTVMDSGMDGGSAPPRDAGGNIVETGSPGAVCAFPTSSVSTASDRCMNHGSGTSGRCPDGCGGSYMYSCYGDASSTTPLPGLYPPGLSCTGVTLPKDDFHVACCTQNQCTRYAGAESLCTPLGQKTYWCGDGTPVPNTCTSAPNVPTTGPYYCCP